MSDEEYTNERLQPDEVNNQYHFFLNKSSLDLMDYIVSFNNHNVTLIFNDKDRTKEEIKNELFLNEFDIVKNNTDKILYSDYIILDTSLIPSEQLENLQNRLNIVFSIINILGKSLYTNKPTLVDYHLIDHYSVYTTYRKLFNFALELTDQQCNTVKKFSNYLSYSVSYQFDFAINFNKVFEMIQEMSNLTFVDDNIDDPNDNTYTQNETTAMNFIANYDVSPIFKAFDLYFYNLIDAVLYDSTLTKTDITLNASLNQIKLNLDEINGIPVHLVELNKYLILDKYQFVHLFDKLQSEEEDGTALRKIASIVARGFYDDSDGTKIFTDQQFAESVKNELTSGDYKHYDDEIITDFETQYNNIITM